MTKLDPFDRCYICSNWVGASGERDHFPMSKSMGGTLMMPICAGCHDLKDRVPLEKWSPSEVFAAMKGLWDKASKEERLLFAKVFHIVNQGHATMMKIKEERPAKPAPQQRQSSQLAFNGVAP